MTGIRCALLIVVVLGIGSHECRQGVAHAGEVTVSWENPRFQANPETCETDSTRVETSLREIRVRAVSLSRPDTLTAVKNVFGREALRDSVAFVFPDTVHYVEFILNAFDLAGNKSCRESHLVHVIPALDTPPAPPGSP